MMVGAVASRFRLFTEDTKAFLARFIIDITLPFLIFTTFIHIEKEESLIKNALIIFVFTFVNLLVLFSAGTLSSYLQKLKKPQATVHTLHTMFGNIVFLGFPLLDALFPGGKGVFFAAIYQLASNSVTFTYGIYRLSNGQKKTGYKSLLNINTIALLLGMTVMLSGLKIPTQLGDAFSMIGKCTSPLSMVYIGALLAGMKMQSMFKTISVYIISFNKLFLIPAFLGIFYYFLFKWLNIELSREAFFVLIMQVGMPCQTIVVVMSQRYGGDYKLAAANLFVTTILSIVSLPLLFYFLEQIYFYLTH